MGRPSEDEIMRTVRYCIARDAPPMLAAATAEWIAEHDLLRTTFFVEGVYEDADYGMMEMGINEIAGVYWSFIKFGTLFVFDDLLLAEALHSPHLVYKRA
jgi:hypothetical protein